MRIFFLLPFNKPYTYKQYTPTASHFPYQPLNFPAIKKKKNPYANIKNLSLLSYHHHILTALQNKKKKKLFACHTRAGRKSYTYTRRLGDFQYFYSNKYSRRRKAAQAEKHIIRERSFPRYPRLRRRQTFFTHTRVANIASCAAIKIYTHECILFPSLRYTHTNTHLLHAMKILREYACQ